MSDEPTRSPENDAGTPRGMSRRSVLRGGGAGVASAVVLGLGWNQQTAQAAGTGAAPGSAAGAGGSGSGAQVAEDAAGSGADGALGMKRPPPSETEPHDGACVSADRCAEGAEGADRPETADVVVCAELPLTADGKEVKHLLVDDADANIGSIIGIGSIWPP